MKEAPIKYSRLGPWTRNTQGWLAVARIQNSLWVGPDHVLSVERTLMNEEYKRFYFRDIQALTVQQTEGAMFRIWTYGSLAVVTAGLFALFASLSDSTAAREGWLITGGILIAFWLLLLVVNLFRGPTCICHLRTAVQTAVLPSLGRLKTARKVLARLNPLIEQTQGLLSADAMQGRVTEPIPPPPPSGRSAAKAPAPVLAPASGTIHLILFGVLILDAAEGLYKDFHLAWHVNAALNALLTLLVTGLALAAVVKQHDATISRGLRRLTVVNFGVVLASLSVGFVYAFIYRMVYVIQHPGQVPRHMDLYSMPGFRQISLGSNCIELGLGIAGLAMTLAYRSRRRTQAPAIPGATPPAQQPTPWP